MRRLSPRPRHGRAGVALAAVALALAAYGTADALDVVPGVLTVAARGTGPAPARPTASDPPRRSAEPALPALSPQAPAPSAAGIAAVVRPLLSSPGLGLSVAAAVVDPATGAVLLDVGAGQPKAPASSAKLLTAAAVLTTVGADTRLPTRVVQGATPDEVVLVGGGDMLLGTGAAGSGQVQGRAGLATLAAQVARALSSTGQTRVAVRFDDSLFAGPNTAATWAAGDVGYGLTGRVSALGLARDRARPGRPGPVDPSQSAATAFAAALRRQGIAVTGRAVRTRAPSGTPVLGGVESAPVADILALALADSDNALAEVLARLTARKVGRPTTFADSALAVMDQVQSLGIDTTGARLVDASGLSSGSVVSARTLVQILAAAAGDKDPRLRPLIAGLPVSGLSGTLSTRYLTGPARAAAGVVRAKTGTLSGVNTLAGVTVDGDGRLLAFVVMADRVPMGGTPAARTAVDKVAAALTACGCR